MLLSLRGLSTLSLMESGEKGAGILYRPSAVLGRGATLSRPSSSLE